MTAVVAPAAARDGVDQVLRRRSVGSAATRSLLLTILGESLARSSRGGWLTAERHGRRARLSLGADTAELLKAGARWIYSFGEPWDWDGRWLVLVLRVPERRREVRHQLRARLAWAGFGSLGGAVWLNQLFLDRHRPWQGPARAYFDSLEGAGGG